MIDIPSQLAAELSIRRAQVDQALALLAEGATVPFIARYRKERTGELNETQLRDLFDRFAYLTELQERQQVILESIAKQGKLTDDLRDRILACQQKTDLEDLYLPYRPKRRTRATIAREKGLEPLADWLRSQNMSGAAVNPHQEAARYVSSDLGVATADDALKGAADILAEAIADQAHLRQALRDRLLTTGTFVSAIKAEHPEGTTKFEMYRSYHQPVATIAPHNLLALCRGQTEGILSFDIEFDEEAVGDWLDQQELRSRQPAMRAIYQALLRDAFHRLLKPSLINEVIALKKAEADVASIKTFESNLRELLLASPAGMKPTLAIDPGFRTGCKVVALDATGQFLDYSAIFPHQSERQRSQAVETVLRLIHQYAIELIAIGNGTAGRETDRFIAEVIATLPQPPVKVMVNESGASIYSASPVAIAEFPELDITVRGAISIGRRLQDPLAELVKLDPKSIGVGQYQHDVDQKLLRKKLDETVESCVNYVGVDLNTASKELLMAVSGITPTIANNIVAYRNQNGVFRDRRSLLKVAKLGPKTFEQAAGFLRIRSGDNPLDNTAVHPESYAVVKAIAKDLGLDLHQAPEIARHLKSTDLTRYVTDSVGEPTLRDMVQELEKPGRDPRSEFCYASFRDDVTELSDLAPGMELEGVVTNVANFGAFVDIGVHQDGLVHISQLADRFVSDPNQIVKVGQVVTVRVLEVNAALKRISLSMRSPDARSDRPKPSPAKASPSAKTSPSPAPKLEDLQAKFNRRPSRS
ncbi:Tex family protein [Leptolyngbya sp. CCY15150]|uniref:Tex family protein n=1 Tax=Leptolyngbya sp. CCY15150 TaxID=2767772 RepID=UPI0019502601|nr:Tex family protein [Leptolyngbya sp. CCY15150]